MGSDSSRVSWELPPLAPKAECTPAGHAPVWQRRGAAWAQRPPCKGSFACRGHRSERRPRHRRRADLSRSSSSVLVSLKVRARAGTGTKAAVPHSTSLCPPLAAPRGLGEMGAGK